MTDIKYNTIPYSDFQNGDIIDAEKIDLNNKTLIDKQNEVITKLNGAKLELERHKKSGDHDERYFQRNNGEFLTSKINMLDAEFTSVIKNAPTNAEVAQALVGADAKIYSTLKQRLDAEHNRVATKTSRTINVEDVMNEKGFTTLQQVLDFIPSNTELVFSKLYTITSELVVSKNNITFIGTLSPSLTNGGGVKNTGTGNAIRVTGHKFKAFKIGVYGNGDPYNSANGATGQHGIVFDTGTTWLIDDCTIVGHGGHGIYTTNGVWMCRAVNNIIYGNALDGINSQSMGSGNNQQNGNNFVIRDNMIAYNGRHGINWRASSLVVTGNDIEQNKGAGVMFDLTGATVSASGILVDGNYIEQNYGGQIKVISATVGVRNILVQGNFFNASYTLTGSATSLIVFTGNATNQYVTVGNNSYSIINTYIVNYADFGNTLTETCKVEKSGIQDKFINFGTSFISEPRSKTRVLSGMVGQRGVGWSSVDRSDNLFGSTSISTFFHLPVTENEMLSSIKMYIESNSTSTYTIQCYLYEGDPKSATPIASVLFDSRTYANGGNNLYSWAVNKRILKERVYYIRFMMASPTTGSSLHFNDVEISIN